MSLPSILSTKPSLAPESMTISTQTIDPTICTNTQAQFRLPKVGVLDAGSVVTLAVTRSAADDHLYFPIATGIHSLIEKATLSIGGNEIASSPDHSYHATMRRVCSQTPSQRAFKDMVKTGAAAFDRYGVIDGGTQQIAPRDCVYNAAVNAASGVEFVRPTNDDSTTFVASIPLSDLIPMMRSRSLPLFAIKDHVMLDLTFRTQAATAGDLGRVCCVNEGQANQAVSVSVPNIKFHADLLIFSDQQMQAVSKQIFSESGLQMTYEDLLLTTNQVAGVANPGGNLVVPNVVEREIAVSGRTVRSLLMHDQVNESNDTLLGRYASQAMRIPSSINYRVNDLHIYDRALASIPERQNALAGVFGMPTQSPAQVISFTPDTDKSQAHKPLNQTSLTDATLDGHNFQTKIRGSMCLDGLDLTTSGANVLGSGTQIGHTPVRYVKSYSVVANQNQARTHRVYASVERQMQIKGGIVKVSA